MQNDINEDTFNTNVQFRRTTEDSSSNSILHRALSTVSANQTLVDDQRNALAKNYRRTSINDEIVTIDHNDADASFILPNFDELSDEIRTRLMDSLVDVPTMVSLEGTNRLNWWTKEKLSYPKLYPLITTGDGNCLLHATSLAMWGFHDHSLSMRRALNETLITSKPNNSLYRRWRWVQSVQNKTYGLVFSEEEWHEEWNSLLRLSSAEPRVSQIKPLDSDLSTDETNCLKPEPISTSSSARSSCQSIRQYYESLEEFHVYVLANNIRRPIIICSDTILRTNDGEAISPIEFGGIYLPLEIPPDKCYKQPVFLAFDAAHFSALVPMEENSKSTLKMTYQIPLIDIETFDLLPIHFLLDPGCHFQWPVNEELSDENILFYTNSRENRMCILERYLSLSKDSSFLNHFVSQPTSTVPQDESTSHVHDDSNDPTNETNTVTTKKSSRSSLTSFSKIIRRTFIHPFSSTKRLSFKHHKSSLQDSSIINENLFRRRQSSPLLNRHTNMLTIILTNFQPKRLKTSDNMIQNYIKTCLDESSQARTSQSVSNEDENHHPVIYYRQYPSLTSNRYRQQIPLNSLNKTVTLTRYVQKNENSDDNEDSMVADNAQLSTNIKNGQRKSNEIVQCNHLESNVNYISDKIFPSHKIVSSSFNHPQSAALEEHF